MSPAARLAVLLALALCCLSSLACRSTADLLGNPDAQLRTGQWWAGPMPDLAPPRAQDRVVWVSYRNATQEARYDLSRELHDALIAQGYTMTTDPEKAYFQVFYVVRFAGENPRADEGQSLAASLGAIGGGSAGALMARAAGGTTPALIGGGLGGALVGALAGTALENYSRVVEYDLILDVRVAQRQKGKVTRTITGGRTARQDTRTSARTAGGRVGVAAASTMHTQQEVRQEDGMLWYENRLVLWARQIRLRPEEAVPTLTTSLLRTLPHILP